MASTSPTPPAEGPLTPLWAMLATVLLAPISGIVATTQTATVACRYHTADACIPVVEGLFGFVVTGTVLVWLATSRRRHRSITSGLALAACGIVGWWTANIAISPTVCPDPGAADVVCARALPTGLATFAVVSAMAWRAQERTSD